MFRFLKWIDFSAYLELLKDEFSNLTFDPANFVEMLGYMGKGMLVIFVIIGVIILATLAIQKLFSNKENKNKET